MEKRLQKILAEAGIASRREAEKIITAGRVRVNGHVVTELGQKFEPDTNITVDGKRIAGEKKVYYVFNKPRGVVTTMSDPEGRRTVADYLKDLPGRLFPVGRLDYNTEGLLLITNDGDLAQKLTHPSSEIKKTYVVKAPGIIPEEKLDLLRVGVKLEDGMTAPAVVNLREHSHECNYTIFDITIHEGRNRQIRRMCDFLGFPVRDLKRIKLGPLNLNNLARGKFRRLSEAETDLLKGCVK